MPALLAFASDRMLVLRNNALHYLSLILFCFRSAPFAKRLQSLFVCVRTPFFMGASAFFLIYTFWGRGNACLNFVIIINTRPHSYKLVSRLDIISKVKT